MAGTLHKATNIKSMGDQGRETQDLERALLKRLVDERAAGSDRCGRCRRTPLVGESVYFYEHGPMLCELCRALERDTPVRSGLVHGPEFGHTMKITDRRAA